MRNKDATSEGDTFKTSKTLSKKQININNIEEIQKNEAPRAYKYRSHTLRTKTIIDQTKTSSKLKQFVTNHPYIFMIICLGFAALVGISVGVPIALATKSKDDNNQNGNEDNGKVNINIEDLSYQSPLTNVDTTAPIELIKNAPTSSLDDFCLYLTENTQKMPNNQKIYLAYYWIASNIQYDISEESSTIDLNKVFTNKKTINSGYTKLFTKILECEKYKDNSEILTIPGYAKGESYEPNTAIIGTNHEWNAVKVNDIWCLIDTAWGAGILKENSFLKKYDDYYLCTPPYQFVRTHLPIETQSEYQFLSSPLEKYKFFELADTSIDFFKKGFYKIENDKYSQTSCTPGAISLYYFTDKNNFKVDNITVQVSEVINNGAIRSIIDSLEMLIVINKTNLYEIDFYINKKGKYIFQVMTSSSSSTNVEIVSFFIESVKDIPSTSAFYYPYYFQRPIEFNTLELIKPTNNYLVKGNEYSFNIKYVSNSDVYLRMYCEDIKMERNKDNHYFNDLMIHGDQVIIAYRNSGDNSLVYNELIKYKTSGNNVPFPECDIPSELSIRLESPRTNPLKRGKSYEFKIISYTDEVFSVYTTDRFELKKNGNVYTTTLEIPETFSEDSIWILYKKKSDNKMYKFITFSISS